VANDLNNTYPVIAVDEFQDCVGAQLEFVQTLHKQCHPLILAGDAFQSLEANEQAIDWALDLVTPIDLNTEHRFHNNDIVDAAHALRSNSPLLNDSPLLCIKGSFAIAVYESMYCKPVTLLSPIKNSLKTFLKQVADQSKKKKRAVPMWNRASSDRSIVDEIIAILTSQSSYQPEQHAASQLAPIVQRMVMRQSAYRALPANDESLIEHCATTTVHNARVYSRPTLARQAMTIHSAKNQEFPEVHVVWHVKGLPKKQYSEEHKRRLLYNAITRAVTTCKLIVIGTESETRGDPVLSLLAP
jgi:superfamily I DNA/RNA helicase